MLRTEIEEFNSKAFRSDQVKFNAGERKKRLVCKLSSTAFTCITPLTAFKFRFDFNFGKVMNAVTLAGDFSLHSTF